MEQGLYTTRLESDGAKVDRVSSVLGVSEGGFGYLSRTNRRSAPLVQPPVQSVQRTNALPARSQAIAPPGASPSQGRQPLPRTPAEDSAR